jgi:hypothetical protein
MLLSVIQLEISELSRISLLPANALDMGSYADWYVTLTFFYTYLILTFYHQATKYFAPKAPSTTVETPTVDNPGTAQNAETPDIDPLLLPPVDAIPYWPLGVTFDMHVYLSTLPKLDVYTKWTSAYRKNMDEGLPHFVWENITYGNYNDHRVTNFMVDFPEVSRRYGASWKLMNPP